MSKTSTLSLSFNRYRVLDIGEYTVWTIIDGLWSKISWFWRFSAFPHIHHHSTGIPFLCVATEFPYWRWGATSIFHL